MSRKQGTIKMSRKLGGIKASITNKRKYGDDFYAKAGALGGRKKVPKGFALMDANKHFLASSKGGSRRSKK